MGIVDRARNFARRPAVPMNNPTVGDVASRIVPSVKNDTPNAKQMATQKMGATYVKDAAYKKAKSSPVPPPPKNW
jgi:hypothetical protein